MRAIHVFDIHGFMFKQQPELLKLRVCSVSSTYPYTISAILWFSCCQIYLRYFAFQPHDHVIAEKRQMCFIYLKSEVIINNIFKNLTDTIENLQTFYNQFLYLQSQFHCVSLICILSAVLIAFTKHIRLYYSKDDRISRKKFFFHLIN